jgi:hypothetical protein
MLIFQKSSADISPWLQRFLFKQTPLVHTGLGVGKQTDSIYCFFTVNRYDHCIVPC